MKRSLVYLVALGVISLLAPSIVGAQQNFWYSLKGPSGVYVNMFAMKDSSHIFAGSNEGLYRSNDNGNTWVQINKALVQVNSLIVVTDYILASSDYGIYKSTDNGESWRTVNGGLPANHKVLSLAAGPNGNIFAGLSEGQGVYKSINTGEYWTPVKGAGLPFSMNRYGVDAIAFSPSGHIYASTSSTIVSVVPGVYRSTDNGESWVRLLSLNSKAYSFAFDKSATFIASGDGLYVSPNGIDGWGRIFTTGAVYAVTINSRSELFAGTSLGMIRSVDAGRTWKSLWFTNRESYSIFVGPNDYVLVGTDAGVYQSKDNGASWKSVHNGFKSLGVSALVTVKRAATSYLFAGTGWVSRLESNWNTWGYGWIAKNDNRLNRDGASCLMSNSKNYILAGTNNGVYQSVDNGENWTWNAFFGSKVCYDFAKNPAGHLFLLTNMGVYRSIDDGNSWLGVNSGISGLLIHALTTSSKGYIFIGGEGGVYRSDNNGNSWSQMLGLKSFVVTALTTNASGDVFAGTRDYNEIYKSADNGTSWTRVLTIKKPVSCLFADKSGVYVGTWGDGIYKSADNGGNWSQINSGLDNLEIGALATGFEERLVAGTQNGAFQLIDTPSSVGQEDLQSPSSFTLLQNYPNPFNPETEIRFQLPEAGQVMVRIFNIRGQEIRTLVNAQYRAGSYSVRYDGKDEAGNPVASGVYLYQLLKGKFSAVKKMIIVR